MWLAILGATSRVSQGHEQGAGSHAQGWELQFGIPAGDVFSSAPDTCPWGGYDRGCVPHPFRRVWSDPADRKEWKDLARLGLSFGDGELLLGPLL